MKRFKIIFLIVGLVFFAFLVKKVGPNSIGQAISSVGWNFLVIFGLYFLHYTLQNFAWAIEMRKTFRDVGFGRLYQARIAGEAMNGLIPLGNFGGEPVKAYLLDDKADKTEIISSLVLDKTIFSFGALLYVFTGLLTAVIVLGAFSLNQKTVIFAVIALMTFGLVLFVRKKDFFSAFFERVKRLGIARNFLSRKMESIEKMDSRIASFYRADRGRFLAALMLHFSAKLLQALEFYLVFRYLGYDLSFAHALCVNSLAIVVNAVFFFIPGHWGVTEGAQGFIFMALGLPPADGVTVGVVRRIRHIFWTFLGLGLFYFSDPRKRKEVIHDIGMKDGSDD